MNCCDYKCTQGRNCPVRATTYKTVYHVQKRPVEVDIEHDEYANAFRIPVAIIAGVAVLAFTVGFVFERVCI
jgi:hypothetical protein